MFPIKQFGCITVPSPILADEAMVLFEALKGLKWLVSLLKSLKGSSDIRSALPSGQSTSLLIKIIVAEDSKALS